MKSGTKFHYLIPNETDEMYGCTINSVGSQDVGTNAEYPLGHHPEGYLFKPEHGRILHEYQLLYIVRGSGTFTNDDGTFPLSKGNLVLLCPGKWHTYKPKKETGWHEYYIGFSGCSIERAVELLFPGGLQIVNVGLNRELVDLYQQAITIADNDRPAAQQLLCGIVMHMLGIINYTVRNEQMATNHLMEIVEQAKTIMQEHILENLDLEILAEQLNISYSWFRKIFRDYTGYPPAKYFMRLKLRHAQYLLSNTRMPIKEISLALNFKSAEHFYTTFKRVMGNTPNAFRCKSTRE